MLEADVSKGYYVELSTPEIDPTVITEEVIMGYRLVKARTSHCNDPVPREWSANDWRIPLRTILELKHQQRVK